MQQAFDANARVATCTPHRLRGESQYITWCVLWVIVGTVLLIFRSGAVNASVSNPSMEQFLGLGAGPIPVPLIILTAVQIGTMVPAPGARSAWPTGGGAGAYRHTCRYSRTAHRLGAQAAGIVMGSILFSAMKSETSERTGPGAGQVVVG